MTGRVPFFLPYARKSEVAEDQYQKFADWVRRPAPPLGRRVQRIEWVHDGGEWVAEVDMPLHGSKTRRLKRGGEWRDVTTALHDPAVVLAVFPDAPYLVVTNAAGVAGVRSAWGNPFMAGEPRNIVLFDETAVSRRLADDSD